MANNKLKTLRYDKSWTGVIPTEEVYEKLRKGEVDWKEEKKKDMTMVKIPTRLFYRLMELDNHIAYTKDAIENGSVVFEEDT